MFVCRNFCRLRYAIQNEEVGGMQNDMEAWLNKENVNTDEDDRRTSDPDPIFAAYLEMRRKGETIPVYEPDDTVRDV